MPAELRARDDLSAIVSEEPEPLDELVPLLYEELRIVARKQLRARRHNAESTPTLATTALVNEAYLKLVEQSPGRWKDRAHFLALCAVAMRHILVDRARARLTSRRGGRHRRVSLNEETVAAEDQPAAILEIDEAVQALERLNPRLARVVESRFFAGLSEEQTAEALGVTVRTVQRDWAKARMLLRRALTTR